jgi:hypothetical protein
MPNAGSLAKYKTCEVWAVPQPPKASQVFRHIVITPLSLRCLPH